MSGALHLWAGFLFTCTLWAAIGCHLVDRKFSAAAVWALIAALLLLAFGIIHGYQLTPTGPVERIALGAAGWAIPFCYLVLALVFLGQEWKWNRLLPGELAASEPGDDGEEAAAERR